MFPVDVVSDLLVLVALVFTGWYVFKLDRKLKKNEDEEISHMTKVMSDLRKVRKDVSQMLYETKIEVENLSGLLREAEATSASVSTSKASLSLEVSKGGKVSDELKFAREAADRSCDRLASAISRAASVFPKDTPTYIDYPHDEDGAPTSAIVGDNVVQLSREAK